MRYILFLILYSLALTSWAKDLPLIAVASNLRFAVEEIARQFQQDTGKTLQISYGSSGHLSQQITHGAPFELFLSANQQFIERLPTDLVAASNVFAYGQLVLLTSNQANLTIDSQLQSLKQQPVQQKLHYFAIANPAHAPFGIAARNVMQTTGLWHSLKSKLVKGENAAQAVQFVTTGFAQAGLVPYSLALAPTVKEKTQAVLLATPLQPELAQSAALLQGSGRTAQQFYHYLQQSPAQSVLLRYGYRLPTGH